MISSIALLCATSAPFPQQIDPRELADGATPLDSTTVQRTGGVVDDGAVFPAFGPRISLPVDTTSHLTAMSDDEVAGLGEMQLSTATIHDQMYFDEVEGTQWVRGRAYKASADKDGFTYIPFLGSQASRNWPVSFRVASATVGGRELEIQRQALVQRMGQQISIDRGPVDAIYELALDQVEQIFRVQTGALSGNLVLTLDVETDMDGAAFGEGLRFTGSDDGGMDYGAAFVLDPSGNRMPIRTAFDGETIKLTVPASIVAELGGEVVIDPIQSTWGGFLTTADDQIDFDAAYDASTDDYGFAYEDPFSATDNDVFLTVCDINGSINNTLSVDFTTATWQDPEVAGMNGDDTMLIVATRVNAADDEIVGRVYDIAGAVMGTAQFVIGDTGTAGWTNARPDVGGNQTSAAGNPYLVCWERTFNANGQTLPRFTTVLSDGTVGSLGTVLLPNNLDAQCNFVRVSESTGSAGSVNLWNIAWAFEDTSTGVNEVFTAQLNSDASLAAGPNSVANLGTGGIPFELDVSDALEIDGLDPTYLITYDDFGAGPADVEAIICRNASFVNSIDINEYEHGPVNSNQNFTRIATTVEDFVLCYAEFQGGEWVNVVTAVDLVEGNQLAISERRTILTPANSGVLSGGPGMASRWSGGLNSRFVGIGWDYLDTVSGEYDGAGVNFFASNPDSPAFQYCDGVVNSTGDRGFLRLEGSRSATSDKTAVASALPPNQFCLLVGGSAFGNVPMAGGSAGTLCLGGSLGRYNSLITLSDAGGVAEFPIDPAVLPQGIGTVPAAPGQIFQWQVWHRDFAGGGATSNFTNAVTILFN